MENKLKIVLVIGSAPDAVSALDLDTSNIFKIVAINNAWQIRSDWDFLIHPEDFPVNKMPKQINTNQQIISADEYVDIQNTFGGFVYAGGTMSFTTAYWVLGKIKPNIICFIGCDMIYPTNGNNTHFYGVGTPDPLRDDVTLQSLEAKSSRLYYTALQNNCLCLNLSENRDTRLTFPRAKLVELNKLTKNSFGKVIKDYYSKLNTNAIERILKAESDLGYYFKSGKYWEHLEDICPLKLQEIDSSWLENIKY